MDTDEDELQFTINNILLQPVGSMWLLDTILLQSLLFKCPKNCN
jgi:hypothetical protein